MLELIKEKIRINIFQISFDWKNTKFRSDLLSKTSSYLFDYQSVIINILA